MQDHHRTTTHVGLGGVWALAGGGMAVDRSSPPLHHPHAQGGLKCPRCESVDTKFCYYNNYNLSQPRHFCRSCRRYWTRGGALRNVPIGGGCRRRAATKDDDKQRRQRRPSLVNGASTSCPQIPCFGPAVGTATASTATASPSENLGDIDVADFDFCRFPTPATDKGGEFNRGSGASVEDLGVQGMEIGGLEWHPRSLGAAAEVAGLFDPTGGDVSSDMSGLWDGCHGPSSFWFP